jgi:phenylalanyl-tRNA synthetase beta chain
MTISLDWLRDYLNCDITPEGISVVLTDIGLEVDGFERREAVSGGLAGVVVGHVLTCGKHPDADRLSVTTVDVGGEEPLQIVCGAPNVAAGQKVLVATVGTQLGEDFKIKRSKIRGVESLGMICAEDELGLGTSHDGIMVLPVETPVGLAAKDFLGLEEDYIIEIGLTPNRVDAASHWGVARDLAAWAKVHGREVELHLPSVEGFEPTGAHKTKVEVADTDGAPRYSGVTISGVRVAPSPEWLQKRLRAIGLTPHNNVVDVTNYVLHEVGQPLHAFDADKIVGGVVVRTCPEGTKFTTLDGVVRTLAADDLLICDAEKPMCIAGVYGGLDSGVTEGTTTIFLESAYFNPTRIRRTARRHGLNTDASFRYERGADPNITLWALRRAAMLITELAGGEVSPVTDIYPEKIEDFYIELSFKRVNALIGKELLPAEMRQILEALGMRIAEEDEQGLRVFVPPFRVDVQREADLVEEILRIYGYNNVELPKGLRSTVAWAPRPDVRAATNAVADFLTSNGFNEAMSNSLTSASYYEGLETYPAAKCVKILNPLSSDLGVMRQTLLFGALEAVRLNINHRNPDLKLYEFGNVYTYNADASGDLLAPYAQRPHLMLVTTGNAHEQSWNVAAGAGDYFYLRGVAEKLLRRFGVDIYTLKTEELADDIFAGGLAMELGGKPFMRMGVVAGQQLAKFDIKQPVNYIEMDFGVLLDATDNRSLKVAELSRYPEVRRDLALLVDRSVTFAALREAALRAEKKLLREVTLFDVYEGDKLPAGKKSYALGFTLEDKTRTLADKDIDRAMQAIAERLNKDCGATVRQ